MRNSINRNDAQRHIHKVFKRHMPMFFHGKCIAKYWQWQLITIK